MATQALTAATTQSNESLILALHARYEAGYREYNRLDEESTRVPEDDTGMLKYRYRDGMSDNFKETEILRKAVLWQVPTTFEEATVLAYHLWSLYENEGNLTKDEGQAMEIALTSLFDFLVTEGCASMENIGEQFSNGAMLAFMKRRARTGQVDQD